MLHFLKAFLDIVLWRRGPQDLPASRLLLGFAAAAYVLVSIVQLAVLKQPPVAWLIFVIVDPLLLSVLVFLLLRLFDKETRFLQTLTAVLGTGAVLGLGLFLPVDWLAVEAGISPRSTVAGMIGLAEVVLFALVNGRILKLSTDTSLYTGISLAFVYVLLINLLLSLATGRGA